MEKYRTKNVMNREFCGRWFFGRFWVGFGGGFCGVGFGVGWRGAKWVSKGNGQNGVCCGLSCCGLVCVVWVLCMVVVMVRRWLLWGCRW